MRLLLITLVTFLLAAAAASAAEPLAKGISMNGPQPLRTDAHPNDYRYWGNPELFTESGTGWVKLWVSWADIQQEYEATTLGGSWNQLNTGPAGQGYLKRLDAQIRAANDDGRKVMVTLYQAFPTWANGATGPDPLSTRPAAQKLPADLSPDGPWGWFVGHLSARYDGSYNSVGPHEPRRGEDSAAWRGNPSSARIDALEVVNEPNLLYWPNEGLPANVATMIRSAEELSYRWGGQAIVGPATSDHPDPGAEKPGVTSDWRSFTAAVLDELAGFSPRVPVFWSHHNYRDVKYGALNGSTRVQQVLDALSAKGWKNGVDRQLWITEAGLNLGSKWADPVMRETQAESIERNFEAMKLLPDVAVWMQHSIHDIAGNSFKSSLRDDFDYSLPGPGAARPALATWQALSGERPLQAPPAEVSVDPQPTEPEPAPPTEPAPTPPTEPAPAPEPEPTPPTEPEPTPPTEPEPTPPTEPEAAPSDADGATAGGDAEPAAGDPSAPSDGTALTTPADQPASAAETAPAGEAAPIGDATPTGEAQEPVAAEQLAAPSTPSHTETAIGTTTSESPLGLAAGPAVASPLGGFVVRSPRFVRLRRGLRVAFEVRSAGILRIALLTERGARLAATRRTLAQSGAGRLTLRLGRRSLRRAALIRGRSITVRAVFTPGAGDAVTRETKVRIRRP